MKNKIRLASVLCAIAVCAVPLSANPIFDFTLGSGITVGDPVYDAFETAAAQWSALFSDDVTINLTIDFAPLGPGILGSTDNTFYTTSYTSMKGALAGDATSASDATAVLNLQPGNSLTFATNHTSDCSNCSALQLDNNQSSNNKTVLMTGAEAKALGYTLPGPTDTSDGSITFSSDFSYDYDPTDGITPGDYDLVGIATHEIGHLLGFVSSVDDVDFCAAATANCGGPESQAQVIPTVLDLFRYTDDPTLGIVMDLGADNQNNYFSIDGGTTAGPLFSNGLTFGDGHQASHWKDSLGIGIMDPTAAPGELLAISQNDIQALDVTGWDVAAPEPSTSGLLLLGAAGLVLWRRKYTSNT